MAYVGTFSSPLRDVLPTQVDLPPGNGRGIHLYQVDRTTGAMMPCGVYELGTSPNCLALNAAGTHLYSSNETDRVGEGNEGTVSAFAINRADGQLALLNTVRSGGAGPTYVSIHPSRKFVLVANYFGGSVAVLPILPNGRLGAATDIKQDGGTVGPKKATHAPPGSFAFSGHDRTHAHMIQADSSGRFVLHADLGLDRIFVWKFDERSGVLTPNDPPGVSLPAGDGPRHFFFHPNRRWCYSLQEEASNIVLFDYDAAKGRLASRQTISSLPPGFAGSNFCSEIIASGDGRFVYAGNRLHDSIGIFAVGNIGSLPSSARNGHVEIIHAASISTRPDSSYIPAISGATTSRCFAWIATQADWPSPATTPQSVIHRASCSSTSQRRDNASCRLPGNPALEMDLSNRCFEVKGEDLRYSQPTYSKHQKRFWKRSPLIVPPPRLHETEEKLRLESGALQFAFS
jgi:6-phosphogluconolactonase (cycloisomerase 2 family)